MLSARLDRRLCGGLPLNDGSLVLNRSAVIDRRYRLLGNFLKLLTDYRSVRSDRLAMPASP